MNLEEIKNYWIESSDEDFDTAETLYKNKKFSPSMFFLHLAIEKNLKEFAIISTFNIQTRYNDYKRDFHNICDKNFADKYLSIGKDLILWLKSQMK